MTTSQKMKILVTGASGFLGRHLCQALKKQGHEIAEVNSKNCDLTKEGSLNSFNQTSFDYIFHLAVWIQAGDFPARHPGDIWIINQKMNTNLLSWWKDCQSQAKLISMGTSCAYPAGTDLKEADYLNGAPHESLFAYAMTKRMLYAGLESLSKQYGMKYLCFAFSAIYGTEYYHKSKQCHFIIDLVRKIINAKNGGEPAKLWGDGYQKRELLYVQDLVSIILSLMAIKNNQLINVSTGKEHTIRSFAESICQIVGYDSNLIEYDTTKYVGARSKCLNNERLKSFLPEFQFTPLEIGLQKTIEWYMDHQMAKV